MPLTEPQVRSAKPASKPFKLYDSEGLFLFVTPSGGKLWRYRFRFALKAKDAPRRACPKGWINALALQGALDSSKPPQGAPQATFVNGWW